MLHHDPSKRWTLQKVLQDPFLKNIHPEVDFKALVSGIPNRSLESENADSLMFAERYRSVAKENFFEARGYQVDHNIQDVIMPQVQGFIIKG